MPLKQNRRRKRLLYNEESAACKTCKVGLLACDLLFNYGSKVGAGATARGISSSEAHFVTTGLRGGRY